MNGNYSIGDTVFDNWVLVDLLGEGSYGKVFEAHRIDFGVTYKSAIKIMTVPESKSELRNIKALGLDRASLTSYFHGIVEDMVREFELMAKLQGTAHVVSYLDHAVIPHTRSIGWDILLRMELLKPLTELLEDRIFSRREVIHVGIDMCRALELCERHHIVHRDIKPANMFLSEAGDYKLGDFGVARTMERSTGVMSQKGTPFFMAPEIIRNEAYGSNVDIYSLGIVLYSLLNGNRVPFLPPAPEPIRPRDRELAMEKRLLGVTIPKPSEADDRLADIVLKACAYSPKDRYSKASQMRKALEALEREEDEPKEDPPKKEPEKTEDPPEKEPKKTEDPPPVVKEKKERFVVGLDIRDHTVSVSGFRDGQSKLLLSFPVKYTAKKDVLLQPECFNDLVDTLMTRLFEQVGTADVELLFCVPNEFGKRELDQLGSNIRENRLKVRGVVLETDAVAYAAKYRDLVKENEIFLVGSSIDGTEAASDYKVAGGMLQCGRSCYAVNEDDPLPIWPVPETEKIILVGEQSDCRELFEKIRGEKGSQTSNGGQKPLIRYHNWVTIGMGLLAGEASGKQNKIRFLAKE